MDLPRAQEPAGFLPTEVVERLQDVAHEGEERRFVLPLEALGAEITEGRVEL